MFGLEIFVRVQTFRRVPPVLPRNFCHPAQHLTIPTLFTWSDLRVVEQSCWWTTSVLLVVAASFLLLLDILAVDMSSNSVLIMTITTFCHWSILGDGLHDHKRTYCLRNFVLFFRLGSVFKCIFWKRKIFVIRWKFITMGLVFLCFCKLQILSLIQIFSIIWSFYFSGFLAHNKYCHLPCFRNCNLVLVVWISCKKFLQLHILQPILSSI